jgi:hypothetical protein
MTSFGFVEVAKLMKLVCFVTIASKTLLMKDTKSIFTTHKQAGVAIVAMQAHGSQKDFAPSTVTKLTTLFWAFQRHSSHEVDFYLTKLLCI